MSNRPSLRARWLLAVKRTRLVGPSCRRMLTEIGEHHMTEAGRVAVTQERLAATLGLSVVRVKHLFREARTAQFLDLVQTGYRGYPTIHHAMIPAAARTEDRLDRRSTSDPLSRARKGVDPRPPISGKGVDVTDPLSPPESARKGVDTRPPTARVKERQTPTTPAPLRESRAEQSGGAPPPAPPSPASLRSSGGADEKQYPFFLRRSPERSEWARGSGGQAAPRLRRPSARPVNPTHDGTRGRVGGVGGVGGGNAERDRQKAIDDLALRIVEATKDAADPPSPDFPHRWATCLIDNRHCGGCHPIFRTRPDGSCCDCHPAWAAPQGGR